MSMESMIAFRDAAFWWIGCWALFSGVNIGIAAAALKHSGKRIRLEDAPETASAPQFTEASAVCPEKQEVEA